MFFCFCVAKVAQFCKQASCFRQKMHKKYIFVHFLSKTPSTAARQFTSLFLVHGQILLDYSRNPGCHGVGRDIFRYHASCRYIVTPGNTVTPAPNHTLSPTFMGRANSSPLLRVSASRGCPAVAKQQFGPTNTLSPNITFAGSSITKLWFVKKLSPTSMLYP